MGCLATERDVEYLSSGCSFKSTGQLAGAMAFCRAKYRTTALFVSPNNKPAANTVEAHPHTFLETANMLFSTLNVSLANYLG